MAHRDVTGEAQDAADIDHRSLFQTMPQGVVYQDRDGRVILANPAAERILGLTLDQMLGRTSIDSRWESIHEDGSDFPGDTHPAMVALRTGECVRDVIMGVYSPRDDRRRWINVNATPQFRPGEDSPYQVYATLEDVTRRREAEVSLRESEEILRVAAEQLDGVLWIVDAELRFKLSKGRKVAAFGLLPDQIVGMTMYEFFQTDDPDHPSIAQHRRVLAGEVIELEAARGETTFAGAMSPMRNDEGEVIGVVGVAMDVTELTRAQDEKSKLEARLQHSQKLESIGTLAGGIAHDFNNLLTGILGYSDLLKHEATPGTLTFEACDVIKKSAARAAELTKQLLGFARRGKLRDAPVDMHRVARSTVTILGRTIDKRIAIEQRLEADRFVVKGDVGQLEQVVMNIAINAGDAMPDGGDLVIETSVAELDEAYCRDHHGATPGTYLRLSISDTGTGIPDDILPRIFDPFYTTKRVGEGTGMGLAMAYGIVRNHDGHIVVESEGGSGTTFSINLPLVRGESQHEDAGDYDVPGSLHGRILVVDDEEGVRHFATSVLTQLGCDVVGVCNGAEAVAYCEEHISELDLVILDLAMPEMGGRDCFYALQKLDPGVKIIIATGHALDSTGQELLDQGALRFFQKPFTSQQLILAVSSVLRG